MANQFDSSNYPTTEPSVLIAGDYWAWKRSDLATDYPLATYDWSYSCVLEGAPATKISIAATESGTDYVIEVDSATTATYTAGTYHWTGYITRTADNERIALDSGTFELLPNPATTTTDPRSHVKITLDALEAMIEGKASKDQKAYTIGNRSLERMSVQDLLAFKKEYQKLYAKELNDERIANGKGSSGTIKTRFR